MEMEEKRDLIIPTQNPDRDEIVSGIGAKEITVIIITFFICICCVIVIYLFTKSLPAGLMVAFLVMALTIMLVIRDRYGESIIDKVRIVIRYIRMQKKYAYRKKDVYGGLIDE